MKFKALIPILSPFLLLQRQEKQREFLETTFNKMIQELKQIKECKFYLETREEKAKIFVEEADKETIKKYDLSPPIRIKYCLYITIDIDIKNYRKEEYEKQIVDKFGYCEEEIVQIIAYDIVEEFKKSIHDFRIALNLAFPGFFNIGKGYIFIDDRRINGKRIEANYGSLEDAILEARQKKWPKIEILKITDTWEWLLKRENFIKKMSSNAIERALSAFTYLFRSENYEDLFYSLIGLEAIYTNGKQGILEQLREKSSALFGEPKDYKNSLSKMYDVRSKFVHGSLNFPSKYQIYENEEFEQFERKEYYESLMMAEALLVATIQQFVKRDAETIQYNLEIQFD